MKKIFSIIMVLGLFLTGCSSIENDVINVNSATMLSFLETNFDTKYVYVGRPTCPNCVEYQPIVEEVVSELNVQLYYYNTDDSREEEQFEEVIETFEIVAVPTILKIEDGVIVEEIIGSQTVEDTLAFFK